jgi:hypothetical protein
MKLLVSIVRSSANQNDTKLAADIDELENLSVFMYPCTSLSYLNCSLTKVYQVFRIFIDNWPWPIALELSQLRHPDHLTRRLDQDF